MRSLHALGWTFLEIAAALGRTRAGCNSKGTALGLRDTKRIAALKAREPRRRHNKKVAAIKRNAKNYSKGKARRVIALLKEGVSTAKIAAAVPCHQSYVTYVRRQLRNMHQSKQQLDQPKTFVERALEAED